MRFFRNILTLILSLLMVSFMATPQVGAQSTSANAAQGLQISPTRVELNASKGGVYSIKLNVTNVTASDLSYSAIVSDFKAKDETGTPALSTDDSLPETASIRTWVQTVPKFTLKSREARDIVAQIIIPSDAEPGGHYGALSFSSSAPELEGTGVGLSASTGMLILIRVDGEINEEANLASFYSSKDDKQSSFFENAPITFVTRINNKGNIHIKPVGNIEIRDIFGGLVTKLTVNSDESNVLPSSTRRFESVYEDWMIGRYTANLTLGYGTTGQAITSTIFFWVIPWKIILAAVAIIFTIIYVFARLIRVYNRHIIEKSKNEHKKTKNNQEKS